jgi:methionyl-tRNA synthetase
VPDFRFNEIKEFVKRGLQDFSISRLKEKMPWGVPVPGDEKQVMYVWFDALINYVSTLGWPDGESETPASPAGRQNPKSETNSESKNSNSKQFAEFWGTKENPNAIQIAGKDNLRQQSAMWQAMLMSAGLPNSKQIIIHGFITSGGQKMSKSLGNVADPYQILSQLQQKGLSPEQATDALRYYLVREVPTFEDGDYTWERFIESYNANLANGIGNLTSRILKMAANVGIKNYELRIKDQVNWNLNGYNLKAVMDGIWRKVGECDEYIQKTEPFKKVKTDEAGAKNDIEHLLSELHQIALSLQPFLPFSADNILNSLNNLSTENIPRLFPRIS